MKAIEIEGLTKRFGDSVALDGLNLVVGEGSIFGFLGPNGAGKTTTQRLLVGLPHLRAGHCFLCQNSIMYYNITVSTKMEQLG